MVLKKKHKKDLTHKLWRTQFTLNLPCSCMKRYRCSSGHQAGGGEGGALESLLSKQCQWRWSVKGALGGLSWSRSLTPFRLCTISFGDAKQDLLEVFHPSETVFSSLMVSNAQNSMVEEETLLLQVSAWGSAYSSLPSAGKTGWPRGH